MKDKIPIPTSIHKKMLKAMTKPREKTKTKKQPSYPKTRNGLARKQTQKVY
jgi:hypothetical protein